MKGNHYFFDLLFFSVNYLSEGHLVTLWSQIHVHATLCEQLFHFRELGKFFLSFFPPKKCCRPSTTFSWWQKIVFVVALVLSTAIDSQKNFPAKCIKNNRSKQKNKFLRWWKNQHFGGKFHFKSKKTQSNLRVTCWLFLLQATSFYAFKLLHHRMLLTWILLHSNF